MSVAMTRVLSVEDDPGYGYLIERFLNAGPDCRFVVEKVKTARDALVRLERGGIDVVLLDLGLPDSEGFDTVLSIRNDFPGLPVVVLTGNEDEALGLQAIECGAQDFMAKGHVTGQLLFRSICYAIARQNQFLHCKTEASTDALTELPNRRSFDTELSRRLAQWKRYGRGFSLMMLDVDHFKQLNDTHGHRAGDAVLRELASVLKESIRKADIAYRYGGEEFVVILPETALDGGIVFLRRTLEAISDRAIEFDGKSLNVTASIGLTEVLPDDEPATMLERADVALYAAKSAGRNRGCVSRGSDHDQVFGECRTCSPA